MKKSSSVSMYAGFPLGGRRQSASSLGDPRYERWEETRTESLHQNCVFVVRQDTAPNFTLQDYKQIMRGLNNRLNGYLSKRVMPLEKKNFELSREIELIVSKRKAVEGRDWHEIQKTQEELRQEIKKITMKNANLQIEVNSNKMANDDLQKQVDDEINAQKVLEKELEDMKKVEDETKRQKKKTEEETDKIENDIVRIKDEHKTKMRDLCNKIRMAEVIVEIEPGSNDLTSIFNEIRSEYENIYEQNWKETEEWYRIEFEKIKVVEAQNTEALESGNAELKNLQKSKLDLELSIHAALGEIKALEGILEYTEANHSFKDKQQSLELEINEVTLEIGQKIKYKTVLERKLKEEIRIYRELLGKVSSYQSWGLYVEDAVDSKTPDDDEVVQQQQQKKLWNKEEFSPVELATTTN